jgi:hypothetical protein
MVTRSLYLEAYSRQRKIEVGAALPAPTFMF